MEGASNPPLVWIVILIAGVGTFVIRLSFIQLFGRLDDIPPGVKRALRFIPVAVLSALVLPRLVYIDDALVLSLANDQLLAGLVAAIVAWRTENMLATIAVGMGTLWILGSVVP